MDRRAGGRGSSPGSVLGEGIIRHALLLGMEALGLEIEHGAVAATEGHQLLVGAQLHYPALLQHADALGVANGGKAMRDQDGGAMPGGGQQAIENFRFSAYVELRSRLI